MELRLVFDEDPVRYDRARPGYPDSLVDALFDQAPPHPKILEVGPGSGQLTRTLLARGANVAAVEPGKRFVEYLRSSLPSVELHHGDFETAQLPAHFDIVTAATAYHWIQPDLRMSQPHQLLRPDGLLAVIDLIQVSDPVDEGYFEPVQPIYAAFDDNSHNWNPPTRSTVRPAIADELAASDLFDDPVVAVVNWDQPYTSAQYRDLLMTYSGTLCRAPAERLALVDQLVAVVDEEFGGSLVRPLVATLTTARAQHQRA